MSWWIFPIVLLKGQNWSHETMFRDRFSLRTWKLCSTEKRKLARGLPLEIWVVVFQIVLEFSPQTLGKMNQDFQFDLRIFFRWVGEKSPTRNYCIYFQDGCIIQSHAPPTRGSKNTRNQWICRSLRSPGSCGEGLVRSVQTWWERVTTDATQWCKVLPRLQLHMGWSNPFIEVGLFTPVNPIYKGIYRVFFNPIYNCWGPNLVGNFMI